MDQLIATLDLYFGKKAPQLPENARNIIVKIAPYLVILGVLFSLPAIFALLGLSVIAPQMMVYNSVYGGGFWISAIIMIAVLVLEVIALPGLFKRTMSGWNFSFYAVLVSALQSLVRIDIVSLILGLGIGFYILFQVRGHYTGVAPVVPPMQG